MEKLHRYIKDIDKIVKKRIKELKIEPILGLNQFIKKNKRFYSPPCFNERGEKVFFKILITDEIAPAEAIRREIEIRKFLASYKGKLNYPLLISSDSKNFPYWFLSRYLEGKLLGHFYNLYLNNKRYIPLLVEALFSLQEIPDNSIKKISKIKNCFLWKRDYPEYLIMVRSYQKGIDKEIRKKIDFQEIYELFKKKRKFLEKSPLVLAHGDFTLANFVASKGKLVVTDWEQAHLDNFAYDICHLWIQLLRYPDWQKGLLSEFLSRLSADRKEEFQDLFRLIVITEALGELRWSINLCQKQYKNEATRAALKTIEVALRGFNSLLNL